MEWHRNVCALEMEVSPILVSRTKLDSYLRDVYDKEILFRVNEDEVEQIKNGVETIVFRIVNEIAKSEPKLSVNKDNLVRVGSFYEGTKICYPDEFDFIAVINTLKSSPLIKRHEKNREMKEVREQLKNFPWYLERAVGELDAQDYTTVEMEMGKLMLDTSFEKHGPASQLCLYYVKTGGRDVKGIHVDVTAAVKVTNVSDDMFGNANSNDQLIEMARNHQSHLIIFNYNQDLPYIESFTETELQYITTVMSPHHRKVYKILKYLINGEHTTELNKGHVFSSYALKTMMFNHDHECILKCELSTCVLNVLRSIYCTLKEAIGAVSHSSLRRPIRIWRNVFTGKSFSKKIGTEAKKCKHCLKVLIANLDTSIEKLPEYCYESCNVKSLIEYF